MSQIKRQQKNKLSGVFLTYSYSMIAKVLRFISTSFDANDFDVVFYKINDLIHYSSNSTHGKSDLGAEETSYLRIKTSKKNIH
jgi:hypothetical protein